MTKTEELYIDVIYVCTLEYNDFPAKQVLLLLVAIHRVSGKYSLQNVTAKNCLRAHLESLK